MNKAQLVDVIADRLGSKRAASEAVDVVLDTITRSVAKGDRVAITGFGSFEKQDRPARTARNPRTGEKVRVKKTAVPRFRAGQGFRDVVSGAKKLPKLPAVGARATASAGTAPASRTTTTRRAGAATRPASPKPTARVSGKSTAKASAGRASAGRASTGTSRTTKSSTARSAARTSTARTSSVGRGSAKKPATRRSSRKS